MSWVYLIKEENEEENDVRYKIGVTSSEPVKRLKKLQTGNPSRLSFMCLYKTEYPFRLEKMMHDHYKDKNILNEWYSLDLSDVSGFYRLCEKKSMIIESLRDNPFSRLK